MEMDHTEHLAIKETLSETKQLAGELKISFHETLLIRQLVALRWLCETLAKRI